MEENTLLIDQALNNISRMDAQHLSLIDCNVNSGLSEWTGNELIQVKDAIKARKAAIDSSTNDVSISTTKVEDTIDPSSNEINDAPVSILKDDHCVYVEESLTKPKRAKKQPRTVWVVTGILDGLQDFFYSIGGRKYQGKFSFFEDPAQEILDHIISNGRMCYEEQMEYQSMRSEERAARFAERSERQKQQSEAAFQASRDAVEAIPFGQPILVGHYSEQRHRRALDKSDSSMRKSIELDAKSKYWDRRAKSSERKATQKLDPSYLANRISECEADIRKYQRYLDDPGYTGSRARYDNLIALTDDKLQYFRKQLDSLGEIFTPETVRPCNFLKYRGTWYPIKRVNKKSVTISNWLDTPTLEWKVPYAEIEEAKLISDQQNTSK